jgi:carbonic anhydrase/acetyltransferase-like protein (isoleucine patch superfamily)
MGRPTVLQLIRQTVGRALRETGQALDRLGVKGRQLALTRRSVGDDPVRYQDFLSRHRHQMPLLRRGRPVVSRDAAFLAPCSTLIGSVYVGAGSSIFYKSILRADNCDHAEALRRPRDDEGEDEIRLRHEREWVLDPRRFESRNNRNSDSVGGGIFIGEGTNIQDGCIIDSARGHTKIGNGVTVGHLASIHSATVEDHCLIGMGALLQEGVTIGEESFIAAGANVPKNTVVGSGELWVGNPAQKLRELTAQERQRLHYQAREVRRSNVSIGEGNV